MEYRCFGDDGGDDDDEHRHWLLPLAAALAAESPTVHMHRGSNFALDRASRQKHYKLCLL